MFTQTPGLRTEWTLSQTLSLLVMISGWLVSPLVHADTRPADTMAQRMVACTVCHGAQGVATPDGYYPRIAGKPADYLYQQLQNFRAGRRQNAAMAELIGPLSDDYLREMAAYFSSLKLPYPAPARPTASASELRRGEQLVRQGDATLGVPACAQCHGERLSGRQPNLPGLVGLSREYLAAQMGAWRTGLRRAQSPDCMAEVARRLSHEDVAAVAHWIAQWPAQADMAPEPPARQPLPLACHNGDPRP